MADSLTYGFSGPMVCRLTGVTYRQLDYWARTDLVTPSITAAQGSGSKRTYSYSDVLEVKVIKSLLTSGVALNRARQAVECLRNSLGADLASSSLVMKMCIRDSLGSTSPPVTFAPLRRPSPDPGA